MSRKSLNVEAARARFESCLCDPARLPVSFTYGGETFHGLPGAATEASSGRHGRRMEAHRMLDERVEARFVADFNDEFGEMEYTLWFENKGRGPSEILSGVRTLELDFQGGDPVLRGCLGDHDNFYAPYENDLLCHDRYFVSTGGRATHVVFPYFDLVHGDGGTTTVRGGDEMLSGIDLALSAPRSSLLLRIRRMPQGARVAACAQ